MCKNLFKEEDKNYCGITSYVNKRNNFVTFEIFDYANKQYRGTDLLRADF